MLSRSWSIHQLTLCVFVSLAVAHSDHSFDLNDENDAGMPYAERHMHTEHHIDSFDLESFFKIHDLDLNNVWDRAEIEAVYGLHHHSVIPKQGKHGHADHASEGESKSQALGERAGPIVDEVLRKLDKNGDGKISLQEFMDGGPDGLPSFEGYKDLGHHYDEESEYFLHHEELYHSTPETQTDESYTHPEDIEHFRHHAHIEAEEDARERKFAGLDADADLSQDHPVVDPLDQHDRDGQQKVYKVPTEDMEDGQPMRLHREAKDAGPQRLGADGAGDATQRWERMKNVVKGDRRHGGDDRTRASGPYKSKFRKGLRADEF
ncbi:hypothetical protein BD324DRAFT_628197 [Kockovaella imperatae]|uniref:EF-hand domain-containing protein n=1 Tax=Kockovaella imperatae TaxID=4999 RepID=A0A1Y1UE47_9TREE|nr:hypothetical protein BD324DRAFT_628197 [Kockovaella imperatae]ORX36292.1 hypothetical protein BD324DRAFT_628197 [Kockovaella imperatae]